MDEPPRKRQHEGNAVADNDGDDEYELDDCEVIREGKKAYLVEYCEEEIWLPKSEILGPPDEEIYKGACNITITIPRWLAIEKGILSGNRYKNED